MNQELHPKAVHLLDKRKDLDENGFVPDCAVTDNTILLKGMSYEQASWKAKSEKASQRY